jgi:hypothetical protein
VPKIACAINFLWYNRKALDFAQDKTMLSALPREEPFSPQGGEKK